MARTKTPPTEKFYSPGKLILTGEYAVLNGAKSLAIPLKKGQNLVVKKARGCDLLWKSFTPEGEVFFDGKFSLYDFSALKASHKEKSELITKVLRQAAGLSADFLNTWKGKTVEAHLEFPLNYGWGSSASLVNCIARWADVDPMTLFYRTSNGSGCDVACVSRENAVVYNYDARSYCIKEIDYTPSYLSELFIIHLDQKKITSESVEAYSEIKYNEKVVRGINRITEEWINSRKSSDIRRLMDQHEELLSAHIRMPKVKNILFKDFEGSIKSLGAWGGDFVLSSTVEGEEYLKAYFSQKGYNVIYNLEDIILNKEKHAVEVV